MTAAFLTEEGRQRLEQFAMQNEDGFQEVASSSDFSAFLQTPSFVAMKEKITLQDRSTPETKSTQERDVWHDALDIDFGVARALEFEEEGGAIVAGGFDDDVIMPAAPDAVDVPLLAAEENISPVAKENNGKSTTTPASKTRKRQRTGNAILDKHTELSHDFMRDALTDCSDTLRTRQVCTVPLGNTSDEENWSIYDRLLKAMSEKKYVSDLQEPPAKRRRIEQEEDEQDYGAGIV